MHIGDPTGVDGCSDPPVEEIKTIFDGLAIRSTLVKRKKPNELHNYSIDLPVMIPHETLLKMAELGTVLHLNSDQIGYFIFQMYPNFLGLFRDELCEVPSNDPQNPGSTKVKRKSFRLYYGNELVIVWSCASFKASTCNAKGGLVLGTAGDSLDNVNSRFIMSMPPSLEGQLAFGTDHVGVVNMRVYSSFISQYGLWKEEQLTGKLPRTSIQMRFGEDAIDAESVTLEVKRDENADYLKCPFVICDGQFRNAAGNRFFMVPGIADGTADLILGTFLMSLFGSRLSYVKGRFVLTSMLDGKNEKTIEFDNETIQVDLSWYLSDEVVFQTYNAGPAL